MNDTLIKVEGVSKRFCRSLKKSLWYGTQDLCNEIVGRRHGRQGQLRDDEFWALKDVGFELRRGECLGLIGRNGAGKTTLLRLLNGLIKPDSGRIEIRGRVGALIALGAGFNPILTGRENIQINASVLGLSKREIDEKIGQIIEFSEIEEFLDMPVQSYSSGMAVRLGFTVAVSFEPDIMLVDEVLAVGDSSFQRKCFDRIFHLQRRGTSFIIVSHNPYQIERLCQKAAVVHRGRLSPLTGGKEAIARYHDLMQQELAPSTTAAVSSREGTHELVFDRLFFENGDGQATDILHCTRPARLTADFHVTRPINNVRIRFEICSADNVVVLNLTANGLTESRQFESKHRIAFSMEPLRLTSGWYYVNAIAVDTNIRLDTWNRAAEFRVLLQANDAMLLTSDCGVYVCDGRWEIE
ncbi:MAG: ABC transporter ATP-binding protein [Sulfuritalea sp.]|nr:ABC transporter ATP-binding protein [Sulfuritalea sp.]